MLAAAPVGIYDFLDFQIEPVCGLRTRSVMLPPGGEQVASHLPHRIARLGLAQPFDGVATV